MRRSSPPPTSAASRCCSPECAISAIEPLTAADAADAVALWTACSLTRPWNDAHADFARATVLGLRSDGMLIGTVMVGDDGHRGWVYYLAVAEAERGNGLGRTLMAAAENWLRERGVLRLNLMIREGNAAVLGFYAALGYSTSDVKVLQKDL